jgi:UDP-glucose:tetrahydrobiopterin glucosyltransferase
MEALACGTPVVAYRRGGPAEIVRDGETGFLAEPDSVEALTTALGRIDRLERRACRNQAEREFSLAALGERAEAWLAALG